MDCHTVRVAPVIDAHHHLWRYIPGEFDWIDDSMAPLRRDFSTDDLVGAADAANVDAAIAVQARQSLAETDMLLTAAAAQPRIAGVVGWLPLADRAGLQAALDRYVGSPLLVGVRHVVQAEPDGFLESAVFNEGIEALRAMRLTYDLLLHAGQLEEAARFVDRHPQQPFVLDHLAKPKIAAGLLQPWSRQMKELAKRENVMCKLSGMVTEDVWSRWSLHSLRPYLDLAIEAFGTTRVMAGSDWPVCLLATTYQRWWQTLRDYVTAFSPDEQAALFGGNAIRFYKLPLSRTANNRSR